MINAEPTDEINRLDFEQAFEAVKEEVDRILSGAPSIVRAYTTHLMQARGKFIRAYAVTACAVDENNKVHPNAVIFGTAIEILHLATLVHDDVMDNADVRRGIPTLNKKYGRKTAVICGDYLLAAALTEMGKVIQKDSYRDFTLPNYMERICMGEMRQHLNNGNLDLSVYRYLSIIHGKTAALFEASFYAGAILSSKEERDFLKYRQLGYDTGMIFQLTDDCIDFEAEEGLAKKNVQSDYEQGVITLPLIHTFEALPELKKEAKKHTLSRDILNAAVKKAGGLPYTKAVAGKYYNKALQIMETLSMTEEKRNRLMLVLDKAYYGLKAGGKERKNE